MQFPDRNNAATTAAALRLQENCLHSASLWLFVRPFSIVFDNHRWTFDVAREWHVFFTPGMIQTTFGCSDPRENAPLRKELY